MPHFLDSFDLFVFDLDGTLADTREDISDSVNHALEACGRPPVDVETVTRFVGDGARMLIERALGPGAPEASITSALEQFLAHYRDGCVRKTRLYPGVRETLEGLRGRDLAVLTNKPLFHSRKILARLGIEAFFRRIEGGDSVPAKKPDPSGLRLIAETLNRGLSRTLVVGDSSVDVRTAHAAGSRAAFVTYGFRPESRSEEPPDFILGSLSELVTGERS